MYNANVPPSVIFFNDHYCTEGGSAYNFAPGTDVPDLHVWGQQNRGGGWNDLISSAVVPPNTVVEVWKDNNYSGPKRTLGPGVYPNLSDLLYDGTNDRLDDNITSFKVRSKQDHQEWLRKCCLGDVSPNAACGNYANPNGQDCKNLLTATCSEHNWFFKYCRGWVGNLDSTLKNQIGSAACATAENEEERQFCACFRPRDFPKEWESSPNVAILKAQWPCLDATCNDATKSLQPFNKNCPSTLAICSQSEIKTGIESGSIKNQTVQNACGNIFLGGQTETPPTLPPTLPPARLPGASTPPPTTTPPTATTPPPTTGTGSFLSRYSTNQKIVAGAGAVTLLLLLILGIIIAVRRR